MRSRCWTAERSCPLGSDVLLKMQSPLRCSYVRPHNPLSVRSVRLVAVVRVPVALVAAAGRETAEEGLVAVMVVTDP